MSPLIEYRREGSERSAQISGEINMTHLPGGVLQMRSEDPTINEVVGEIIFSIESDTSGNVRIDDYLIKKLFPDERQTIEVVVTGKEYKYRSLL